MVQVNKGLLYRGFTSSPTGRVTSQLVVPSKFGERVMAVGHEALMSGHPGKGRTADRIMSSLYWPGALANIKCFCASCDSCQRTSPRGSTRNVPLVRGRSCPLVHWLVRGRSCPLVHWLVRGRSCPLVHWLVSDTSCPLEHWLVRGRSCPLIHWLVRAERALSTVKERLASQPILKLPNMSKIFTLQADASGQGLEVLLQECDGKEFPVRYASRTISKCEQGYATVEKERLAVVWRVQKFQKYLYGKEFVLETDHQRT